MKPDDPLFRREAVEEYLRGRDHGRLLGISPVWSGWAFALLVAAFLGAAAFVVLVPVGVDVSGPARVVAGTSGAEVLCALPADALPVLRVGQPVALRLGGEGRAALALRVTAIEPRPWSAAEAAAPLGPVPGPVAIVRAAGAALAAPPGTPGVAHVRVGERPLLAELLPARVGR